MGGIFFIASIDTECDKNLDWSVRYPFQFRNIIERIPDLLQPLFDRYKVKPTYLLSPEVITDHRCADFFKTLGDSVELGAHLHGEFVEPEADFNASHTAAFQCDYSREMEKAKISNLTDLFRKQFGRSPLSFRAGRFGLGPNTLPLLAELGYLVDSSLYPHNKFITANGVNNFYEWSLRPFFYESDSSRRILEVPLTVKSEFYSRIPKRLRRVFSESAYFNTIASKILGQEMVRTWSLRPSTYDHARLCRIIDYNVAMSRNRLLFLNLMFHSNELFPKGSPYSRDEEDVSRIMMTLQQTLQYVADLGASFIGLSEAYTVLSGFKKPT